MSCWLVERVGGRVRLAAGRAVGALGELAIVDDLQGPVDGVRLEALHPVPAAVPFWGGARWVGWIQRVRCVPVATQDPPPSLGGVDPGIPVAHAEG